MDFLRRTWAEIDIAALKHNFEIIKEHAGKSKIMAVVKADAYGHHAKEVATLLEKNGADAFAVSNLDEALLLREYGIKSPVLILGYTPPNCAAQLAENKILQTLFSLEYAKQLSSAAKDANVTVKVHIKLDTGMARLGFDCRDENLNGINEILEAVRLENLEFEGIFTHFAVADSNNADDGQFTRSQYDRFVRAANEIENKGVKIPVHHCSNSAASILDTDFRSDYIRPGIILYGLTPSTEIDLPYSFEPVMTLKSVVSMVKTISAGETVSYGRTFTADRDLKIATVTAGYADGYPRLLSNTGEVLIHSKRAKILGKVCMDQMMLDVSDIENVKSGDEVILFGKGLPVEEVAEKAQTVNYEIICGITGRVPRIFTDKR